MFEEKDAELFEDDPVNLIRERNRELDLLIGGLGPRLFLSLGLWTSPLTRSITGRSEIGVFEFLLIPGFFAIVGIGIVLFLWEPALNNKWEFRDLRESARYHIHVSRYSQAAGSASSFWLDALSFESVNRYPLFRCRGSLELDLLHSSRQSEERRSQRHRRERPIAITTRTR